MPTSAAQPRTDSTTDRAPDAEELLGPVLHEEVVRHFTTKPDAPSAFVVRHQVRECLRYLYLVSRHPDRLGGLFLPVEQDIDEIWHYLILQTREYRELCEQRLPGGHFIHHRSISYADYQEAPGRESAAEEALRWVPLYTAAFGPFDVDALPHWTIVRFLHDELHMSLEEIAALAGDARTPDDPTLPVRDHA
ncbi:hypothetical protein AB0E75_31060 [Streptomyces griseoviridis]|jgi:hypothetical protein|uniref:Uncharacterized protein n=1 Tax=Streptomyces griseoviridis TaxID=45398 RepID=A0A918GQ71_STRGD|nr:hypothetical protein [Streptomyces niveoruber]GGS53235.1 hypothetical protein GCM10010238_48300 [Streptomyces niveoruber]